MALSSNNTEPVGHEDLDKWESVGSGGFAHVYKARHKGWGFDVAIKMPRNGVWSSMPKEKALLEEIKHMENASCEFVLRVYGIYLGCPPFGGTHIQRGIVMELMGRGSVESLLRDLCGPPPWPLAFRMAHQVALGVNFLHSRNLIHQDLKPSNVLLTDDLNVKLADLGLSRVSASVLSSKREATGEAGGSYKYMPPEAFEASYEPVRAFDRYSYGILLWSIVTGKEPYPAADCSLVALRIPRGDRPPCEDIDLMEAVGLKELVDLMRKCWEKNPSSRPTFTECLEITENVLSKHKREIHSAVHRVLRRLDSPTTDQDEKISVAFNFPFQTPAQSNSKDLVDCNRFPETGRSSMQVSEEMSDTDKAKFVDENKALLIQDISEVMAIAEELGNMVHGETYSVIAAKATSQEKMRVLYQRTFHPGGVVVKAAFYDILKRHQPRLMERLGD